jgi:hypothetical protein
MINPFLEIVRTANNHNWCMTPYCSTCCALKYRQVLRQLGEQIEGGIADALADLNPSEIVKEHNWQGALLIAIMELPYQFQLENVIKAWLPKFYDDLNFSDFVLYKIVTRLSEDSHVRKEWIYKCISLAEDNKSFSLIESLLLILKKDSLKRPELVAIAKGYAESFSQMRKVLRNVCGIELKKNQGDDRAAKKLFRVLIANSDNLLNEVLTKIIKQVINDEYELKVAIAIHGDDMVEAQDKESIDLYILVLNNIWFDSHYNLPESWEKTLQFIDQIKTIYKRPVIALSGWFEYTSMVEKTKKSADFFFPLPFRVDEFKVAIKRCLPN